MYVTICFQASNESVISFISLKKKQKVKQSVEVRSMKKLFKSEFNTVYLLVMFDSGKEKII